MRRRAPEACLYCDIFDYTPELPSWDALKKLTVQERQEQVALRFRLRRRFCCAHNAFCTPETADVELAGSPCPPFSRFGKRLAFADERTLCLQVWLQSVKTRRQPLVIHENVENFPSSVIDEVLGGLYCCHHFVSSVVDVGWHVINRKRLFSVLFRREGLVVHADVATVYARICARVVEQMQTPSVADLFFADAEMLLKEENRKRLHLNMQALDNHSDDWTYLLTANQRQFLCKYEELWRQKRHKKGAFVFVDPKQCPDLVSLSWENWEPYFICLMYGFSVFVDLPALFGILFGLQPVLGA